MIVEVLESLYGSQYMEPDMSAFSKIRSLVVWSKVTVPLMFEPVTPVRFASVTGTPATM